MHNILLVEDNFTDAQLMHEVFKMIRVQPEVTHVEDGEQAINFLFKQGKYAKVDSPSLVILDLNIPRKSGREVLREIKTHEKFKSIPVAILSNSSSPADLEICREFERCHYFSKPANFREFIETVKNILNFAAGRPA